MIAVLQRVSSASVETDGRICGRCGRGLLILLGVAVGDGIADADALADYHRYSEILASLISEYEQQYGPLHGFGHSTTETGSWVCSAWPWEN